MRKRNTTRKFLDKIRENVTQYEKNNPEKGEKSREEYHRENADKIGDHQKTYVTENPMKRKATQDNYTSQNYEAPNTKEAQ